MTEFLDGHFIGVDSTEPNSRSVGSLSDAKQSIEYPDNIVQVEIMSSPWAKSWFAKRRDSSQPSFRPKRTHRRGLRPPMHVASVEILRLTVDRTPARPILGQSV